MTFLVVDDHAVLRKGLKQVLAEGFIAATILETGTGHDALEIVQGQQVDAVVLDINLPDKSGMEVLKRQKA